MALARIQSALHVLQDFMAIMELAHHAALLAHHVSQIVLHVQILRALHATQVTI